MNEHVRRLFKNIPPINDFITRRMWTCIRAVLRTKHGSLPKKMLGAWVPAARKAGSPQSTLKDNFVQVLKIALKGKISDEVATFKGWLPVAAADKKMELTDQKPLQGIL